MKWLKILDKISFQNHLFKIRWKLARLTAKIMAATIRLLKALNFNIKCEKIWIYIFV